MTKLALLANAASSHTQKWAVSLAERGWEIQLYSFLPAEISAEKVEVIVIPRILGGKADAILRSNWVKKRLEAWQPDLVHAHYATSFGLLGALSNQHPYLISAWGSDIFAFPKTSFLHKKLLQWILKQADQLCSTSEIMAQKMKQYLSKNKALEIIPFGVDVKKFAPRSELRAKLGATLNDESNGRVKTEIEGLKGGPKEGSKVPIVYGVAKYFYDIYGLDLLLQAFAKVLERHPGQVRLKLAGEGPEQEKLQRLSTELKIDEALEWVGPLSNDQVADFYRSLDVVVLPSRQESFGVTAVEGAACGLPVIASRVGGLPEVVVDQKTGLLVPSENVEELARAMEHVLLHPEERLRWGEAGRAFVLERYDWEKNVSQMEKVYRRLLKER